MRLDFYDYDRSLGGPLAPLYERNVHVNSPGMIAPPVGWIPLVLELNYELSRLFPDYTISQVKEKFAGLRFYVASWWPDVDDSSGRADVANNLVARYETNSFNICQMCGEPSTKRSGPFVWATLCNNHAEGFETQGEEEAEVDSL